MPWPNSDEHNKTGLPFLGGSPVFFRGDDWPILFFPTISGGCKESAKNGAFFGGVVRGKKGNLIFQYGFSIVLGCLCFFLDTF